jgi:hypothetical protein
MRKAFILALMLFLVLPTLAQNATMVAIVSQRFENGEMIYRRDNGDIYVISNTSGQWWRFTSAQYGRLAENRQTAPSNRISPANGFGRIWANNETIRSELGWAVNVEIGFEMRFTGVHTGELYLTRLNGIILELTTSGTWRTVSSIPIRDGAAIQRFTVSPQSIVEGGTITVNWETSGADLVQIVMRDTVQSVDTSIDLFDGLPLSGSVEWTIPETIAGELEVKIWLVKIVQFSNGRTGYDWLTSLSRQVDVYQDASFRLETYAAYQAYEHGFMIWREDTGDVRVFFNGGAWQLFPEHNYAGNSDNLWPIPENCVSVVNAFGKLWGAYGDLRDGIGCATASEQGYTLQIRGERNGDFLYSLPDGREVRLSNQTWR